MCNINLLYKEITSKDIPFLQLVSHMSFASNPDAEGIMTPDKSFKSASKLWLHKMERNLVGQPFFASHERWTTHGTNDKHNIHPIKRADVSIMHNGTMSLYDSENLLSDSFMFTRNVQNWINSGVEFVDAVTKSIKNTAGRMSLLIMNNHTKDLYYYKCMGTDFYVSFGNGQFFASTSKDNCDVAVDRYGWTKPAEIDCETLYQVSRGGFTPIVENLYPIEDLPWTDYQDWIPGRGREVATHKGVPIDDYQYNLDLELESIVGVLGGVQNWFLDREDADVVVFHIDESDVHTQQLLAPYTYEEDVIGCTRELVCSINGIMADYAQPVIE